MTKMNLFGTSFVAAIPGAALAYLMLMVVLNNFDTIPMILKVVAIATLLMAAMMLLFPLYVLIWYGGRSKGKAAPLTAAAPAAAAATGAAATTTADDELLDDEELLEEDDAFGEDDEDDFVAEDSLDADDDMFEDDDFGDDFVAEGGLDDEFEFDDFEDDDENF